MAGIGEASAILAVAQIGISLSNTLIAYIGEVQDAPLRIQRIGNEVLTTSERLKDIGELVDKNHQTRIFSDEGILSAARCSEECKKILLELKNVLGKSGWHQQSQTEDKIEIDTSLFSTLRWPFLRTKLEVPRAELNRIKIDLMLLISSAMALGASSAVDKAKFRQEIPGLSRTRDWAARKAEQARRQALDRERDPRRRITAKDEDWIEGEPEMLQEFVDFQERRMREEDDKRLAERAALLLAENEEQKKKAELERRALENQVLEQHKREQDEKQARTAKLKAGFQEQLTRAGFGPDQIDTIIESSNLDYMEMAYKTSIPIIRPAAASRRASDASVKVEIQRGHPNKWMSKLFWRHPDTRPSEASTFGPGHDSMPLKFNNGPNHQGILAGPCSVEAWLIDVYSNERAMLWPSDEWFTAKLKQSMSKKQTKRDVWHEFARLKPLWRTAIFRFLSFKNDDKATRWSLLSIEIPQRSSRTRLFGHKSDDQVVQVIVLSRKETAGDDNTSKEIPMPLTIDDLLHRPVQRSLASSIRGQAGDPAKISEADKIREEIREILAEREASRLKGSRERDLVETRERLREEREEILREEAAFVRDNIKRPIEADMPYGQEVAGKEGPLSPDGSYREVAVPERYPLPEHERFYDGNFRRRGSQNAVAKFDRNQYSWERPRSASRRYEEKEEDAINRERPRPRERRREEEGAIIRRRSKSRERNYGNDDIIIVRNSNSRERSSREDGAILARGDAIRPWNSNRIPPPQPVPVSLWDDYVPNDIRTQRHKDSSNQHSVIRRAELQRPKRYIFPPSTAPRYMVLPYKGSGEIERERPRRNLTNDTSDDMMLSRRTTIERSGAPSQNPDRTLVRPTGGTRQIDGYMRDHVLDRSIRIRGEGEASSPPKIYNDIGRRPFPFSARQYERSGRQQPIQRRLRSSIYSDSEDEDDVRIDNAEKQASSEPKLTDEQLIARTLEKYTNLKTETNPINSVVIPTSIESVALPSVIAEATTKTATRPDDAGDPAPQAGHKQSGEGADSGESRGPTFEEVTDNGTGLIVEEPAVMTDEDGPTRDVRSDTAKRRARFVDEAESSGIARNGYISDPESDSDRDLRYEEETDDRTAKARRKRREARRLLREADDLSDEHRESRRESTPRRTPNSRSATVEDTDLEYEVIEVVRAMKPPILNTQPDAQSEVSSGVCDD